MPLCQMSWWTLLAGGKFNVEFIGRNINYGSFPNAKETHDGEQMPAGPSNARWTCIWIEDTTRLTQVKCLSGMVITDFEDKTWTERRLLVYPEYGLIKSFKII